MDCLRSSLIFDVNWVEGVYSEVFISCFFTFNFCKTMGSKNKGCDGCENVAIQAVSFEYVK